MDVCKLSNGLNPKAVRDRLIRLLDDYDARVVGVVAHEYPTVSGWLDLPEIKKCCDATAGKLGLDRDRDRRLDAQFARRDDMPADTLHGHTPGAKRYSYDQAEAWAAGDPYLWPPIGRFEDASKRKRRNEPSSEPVLLATLPEPSDALLAVIKTP